MYLLLKCFLHFIRKSFNCFPIYLEAHVSSSQWGWGVGGGMDIHHHWQLYKQDNKAVIVLRGPLKSQKWEKHGLLLHCCHCCCGLTQVTIMLIDSYCAYMCFIYSEKLIIFHFRCCVSRSLFQRRLYYFKVRHIFVLILAWPISYFLPGATSEWLTPSALNPLTTTRSMPPCTATEPTGVTGTFTASSTWPCSVRGLRILFTLWTCVCLWERESVLMHACGHLCKQIVQAY